MVRRIQRQFRNGVLKLARALPYRTWMLALLPKTLGVGIAALWLRSLSRPLSIDADGLTLRHHKLPWASIKRIGISRSYLDGHISEVRIHHRGGVSKIPVRELRDGERVAGIILTMFKRTLAARTGEELRDIEPMPDITRFEGSDRLTIQHVQVARHSPSRDTLVKIEAEIANVAPWARDDSSRDGCVGRVVSGRTRPTSLAEIEERT